MRVNNLPRVATQWNSGATRESNPGHRVRIPSALTSKPLRHRCVKGGGDILVEQPEGEMSEVMSPGGGEAGTCLSGRSKSFLCYSKGVHVTLFELSICLLHDIKVRTHYSD